MDFGERLYDPRLGKWFTLDAFKDVYISLSPYSYGADNPVNIIDREGHLLRDKDGNIIATSSGNKFQRETSDYFNEDGKKYVNISVYEEVTIYTDKGTPIQALRHIETYVAEIGEGGSLTRTSKQPSPGAESNCHGYTFAGGQLVIEDNTPGSVVIKTILMDDGYSLKSTEANASGFLEQDTKGEIMHSGKKGELEGWSADHGDREVATENSTLEDAGSVFMQNKGAERTFFENGTSNNNNLTGVKMVSPEQAANAGAKIEQKPKDGVYRTDLKKVD